VQTNPANSIDLRFHWVRDRCKQRRYSVNYVKGSDNAADFYTKAAPKTDHVGEETWPSTEGAERVRRIGEGRGRERCGQAPRLVGVDDEFVGSV
jgi:hypothetical protein